VEWVSGDLVQAPHPSLRLIEAGAALAAGRRVFVVSSYEWSFANHPRCRRFVWPRPLMSSFLEDLAGFSLTSRRCDVTRSPAMTASTVAGGRAT